MRVNTTELAGVLVFAPTPVCDDRGFFTRTFDGEIARGAGIDPDAFRQDSQSRSRHGVVRGIHVRVGDGEAKLVRCSFGAVLDVVVDLRRESPTFSHSITLHLDDVEHRSVYVPVGCGHGFQSLSEPADVCYRIDRPHDPSEDRTIRWDDPQLAIAWPLPVTRMSGKDRAAPTLAEVLPDLG